MSLSVNTTISNAKYEQVKTVDVRQQQPQPSWLQRICCCIPCCKPEALPPVQVEIVATVKSARQLAKDAALDHADALNRKHKQMQLENDAAKFAGKPIPHSKADLDAAAKAAKEARDDFINGQF